MEILTVEDVFFDLASRFFLNLPDEELSSFERVFIQLEQAWWTYEDFYREEHSYLPKFELKTFCIRFFSVVPSLRRFAVDFDSHFAKYREYVSVVPVCGAILLNSALTRCVLVQGFRGNSWSFPRGKINRNESELGCAVREVMEEVGFDVLPLLPKPVVAALSAPSSTPASIASATTAAGFEPLTITQHQTGQRIVLFPIAGVPERASFETQTRNEINEIQWHDIASLPNTHSAGKERNRFWNVAPFVEPLRRWISNRKSSTKSSKKSQSSSSGNSSKNQPSRSKSASSSSSSSKVAQESSLNVRTFGAKDAGWKVEDMFAAVAKAGAVSTYDPNDNMLLSNCRYQKYPPMQFAPLAASASASSASATSSSALPPSSTSSLSSSASSPASTLSVAAASAAASSVPVAPVTSNSNPALSQFFAQLLAQKRGQSLPETNHGAESSPTAFSTSSALLLSQVSTPAAAPPLSIASLPTSGSNQSLPFLAARSQSLPNPHHDSLPLTSSSSKSKASSPSSLSSKQKGSQCWDSRNADTFGLSSSSSSSSSRDAGSMKGWSAEQMFAVNEAKFGVKSTQDSQMRTSAYFEFVGQDVISNKSASPLQPPVASSAISVKTLPLSSFKFSPPLLSGQPAAGAESFFSALPPPSK